MKTQKCFTEFVRKKVAEEFIYDPDKTIGHYETAYPENMLKIKSNSKIK